MNVFEFSGKQVVHFVPTPALDHKLCGGRASGGLKVTTEPKSVTCDACVKEAIRMNRPLPPFPWHYVAPRLIVLGIILVILKLTGSFPFGS